MESSAVNRLMQIVGNFCRVDRVSPTAISRRDSPESRAALVAGQDRACRLRRVPVRGKSDGPGTCPSRAVAPTPGALQSGRMAGRLRTRRDCGLRITSKSSAPGHGLAVEPARQGGSGPCPCQDLPRITRGLDPLPDFVRPPDHPGAPAQPPCSAANPAAARHDSAESVAGIPTSRSLVQSWTGVGTGRAPGGR